MKCTAGGILISESTTSSPSTGGDPYVRTMSGITYKLQMSSGILRMLETDDLIINMEVSSPDTEQMLRMIEYRNTHRRIDGNVCQLHGGYYSKIWIKHKEDICEIDLQQKIIKQSDGFRIDTISNERSSIRYYNNITCKKVPIYFSHERFGSCKLTIELFDSPFIENGMELQTENEIEEGIGMIMDIYKESEFTLTNLYDSELIGDREQLQLEKEEKPDILEDNEIWIYKKGQQTIEIMK